MARVLNLKADSERNLFGPNAKRDVTAPEPRRGDIALQVE